MQSATGTQVWIYCHASEAIADTAVCVVHETGEVENLDLVSSLAARGMPVGVANAAFADNEFGWVQVWGAVAVINVGTSALAHTRLNSTATVGQVDDDATAGSEIVQGMYLTAGESSNAAAGFCHWPYIAATV